VKEFQTRASFKELQRVELSRQGTANDKVANPIGTLDHTDSTKDTCSATSTTAGSGIQIRLSLSPVERASLGSFDDKHGLVIDQVRIAALPQPAILPYRMI
jgi:hypothetical protein